MPHLETLCADLEVSIDLKPKLIVELGDKLADDGQVGEEDFLVALGKVLEDSGAGDTPPEGEDPEPTLSYEDWVPWLEAQGIPVQATEQDPEPWRLVRRIVGVNLNATRKANASFEMVKRGIVTLMLDLAEEPEPTSPPGGTKDPQEGDDMNDREITELNTAISGIRENFSGVQGLHAEFGAPPRDDDNLARFTAFARRTPEEQDLYRQYRGWMTQIMVIFEAEARKVDPKGEKFTYGDRKKWAKFCWRSVLAFAHPDRNDDITRENLEGIFVRNGGNGQRPRGSQGGSSGRGARPKSGSGAGASGGSSSRPGGSSGSGAGSRGGPSGQQRSNVRPPNFDARVATAKQCIERTPVGMWARDPLRKPWSFSEEGITDVAFCALNLYLEKYPNGDFESDRDVFYAAFFDIIEEVFADD
ncbi:hypothetical protein HYX70_01155 [Candidatus Saccharibacteria bacterium]|nr:hypothetical protein [Candidatus Saccharibacteria bacterium]